jgi:hypothetical protein
MALTKHVSLNRDDFALGTPQTRGLTYNGMQAETMSVSKLTGDTTASVDVETVFTGSVRKVFGFAINDAAGTANATPVVFNVTFTKTDYNTLALTSLGDWTRAILFVCGRAEYS